MSIFGLGKCHHIKQSEPHVTTRQISQFASDFKEIKNLSGSSALTESRRSGQIQTLRLNLANAIGTINSDPANHNSSKINALQKINNNLNNHLRKIKYQEGRSQPRATNISAKAQQKMDAARAGAVKNGENNGAYR